MPRLHLEGLSNLMLGRCGRCNGHGLIQSGLYDVDECPSCGGSGNDGKLSAVNQVLCNADVWPHLSRAELLRELRELGRRVLADAKGTEP